MPTSFKNMFFNFLKTEAVGQKILKSPGQKNSCKQKNQFHEKKFFTKIHFCNFKNGQKSIFELGKSSKLPEIHGGK